MGTAIPVNFSCHVGIPFFPGMKDIQEWTRQSLREKPFSTAKGKIWTLTPSHIPLETIYTQLNLVQKERDIDLVAKEQLSDVSQLFDHKVMNMAAARILVTGTANQVKSSFIHI